MAGFEFQRVCASILAACLVNYLVALPAQADITLDGSLGPSGALTGPNYEIPASDGEQVGPNLFHSFGVFSINADQSATFTGPNGIENVLGRVTGGESSSIDGDLNSDIPGANLYLINPAGIMFGPNAQLNVDGSFHASTADYIRLGENGRFEATTQPNASTLTVAPPSAFGFLDNNPARITTQAGTLDAPFGVPRGESLSLVGGDIAMTGGVVFADGGRINIASVASPGEVKIIDGRLNVDSFARLGDIRLSQGALVSANGETGGSIYIRGGNLLIDGSRLFSGTVSGDGRPIDIEVTGDLVIQDIGSIETSTGGSGAAGDVTIRATNIWLRNNWIIGSGTLSNGNSGNITVTASKEIRMSGNNNSDKVSGIITATGASGNAGIVIVAAPKVIMENTAGVLAAAALNTTGRGGTIRIHADELHVNGGSFISGVTVGSRRGGNVAIETGSASLTGGSTIDSSAFSSGRVGSVTLHATQGIMINKSVISSGASKPGAAGTINVSTEGTLVINGGGISTLALVGGDPGSVTVQARDVTLINGGRIITSVSSQALPTSMATGGDVDVNVTGTLLISGSNTEGRSSGIFSNSEGGQGDAGDILINTGNVSIRDGGLVASNSLLTSRGNAGAIAIKVADTARLTDGRLQAGAENTDGGNIMLTAGSVQLSRGSEITSRVGGGSTTTGGNVTIDGGNLVLLDDSQVTANASLGQGGLITINSDAFLYEGASVDEVLDATSGTAGNNGTVDVNSPENDIAGSITRLPVSFLNAAALLSQRCAARSPEDTSSFVIVGRGGVPRGPDDWSISSYVSGASGARKVISGGIESASESAKGKATRRIAMLRLSCARQP